MLIALYEMQAKSGQERAFEEAWTIVTEAIYERRGSLGSRLHKTATPGLYLAYAQWPSQEVYDDLTSWNGEWEDAERQAEVKAAQERMRENTETMKLSHLMEVCIDRLQEGVFGG